MVKRYKSEKGGKRILETYDALLEKWDVEYNETDVATRYGTTHVIKAGDPKNPPLVLFHGVGDDAAMMWVKNAKAWAQKFMVYAVDTMGGPGKSVPGENYGKGFEQCLWLDDMLDALKLDRVNMAGVSNGAYITQLYGAKRPERTLKLVCMAGALRRGDREPGFFELMGSMKVFFPEALFPTKKNMIKLLDKLCGGNSAKYVTDTEVMAHWEALLKNFSKTAMTFHRLIPLSAEETAGLRGRTLFLIGDKDPIAYSAESESFLKENSMDYVIIENAGHSLNYELSGKVNSLVEDFILG